MKILNFWRVRRALLWCFVAVFIAPAAGVARQADTHAIASAHPLATAAGQQVLQQGGNAFDAAIAVAAALAVVEPYSSGLGGGGFFLLHRAADRHEVMIDAREMAPAAASPALFLDAAGKPIPQASTWGGRAAGIPGVPAALEHLAHNYGTLPLSITLAPAIRLARDGFPVDGRFSRIAKLREPALRSSYGAQVYLDAGAAPAAGYLLKQPDLARTLEAIARDGAQAFYAGHIAAAMVGAVRKAGGVWDASDLAAYRIVEREPLRFRYRNANITTAALPSAGGIALAQSLGILARYPLASSRDPAQAHLIIESLRRAFHDRALYVGEPAAMSVSPAQLVSAAWVDRLAASMDVHAATPSDALPEPAPETGNTTHFSVVDGAGNRVAATLSINGLFGAGVMAPGTGVLLNNEMDDFTIRTNLPNFYKLLGANANAVAPGRRPLSSMTPTFVEDSKGVIVLGAPGGSRIISMVLLAIIDYVDGGVTDVERLVSAPRYHHQYWPDRVEIEPDSFAEDWRQALSRYGHSLQPGSRRWGNMQLVHRTPDGRLLSASDPRGQEFGWY